MALYLIRGTYNAESVQGVQANGAESRVEATTQLVESLGGTLVCGPAWSTDNFAPVLVADFPSEAAVASMLMTALGSGAGPSIQFERLLTAEEVDAGLALSPEFRPPSG